MLFRWPARIVSHLGATAVVQVPGGLLLLDDPARALHDGAELDIHGATDVQASMVVADTYSVQVSGQVALLTNERTGQVTPLFTRTGETLPGRFLLMVPVDDSPVDDPDAQAKPFCDPPSNCCPDAVPDQIDHLLPCCCADIEPASIDAVLGVALSPAAPVVAPLDISFLDQLFTPPESTP